MTEDSKRRLLFLHEGNGRSQADMTNSDFALMLKAIPTLGALSFTGCH